MTKYPEIFVVKELVKLPREDLSSLWFALHEDLRRVNDARAVQDGQKTIQNCKE